VRTRKTKHRVYDENAEVKEFELGQAFHGSREFKQALLNYGLKNYYHLLFPKDERKRKGCKIKCSMCGAADGHNKRKCKGNPDVVRKHAEKKKAAKRIRKKQDKEAAEVI
jgi:hypothetical protein